MSVKNIETQNLRVTLKFD